MQAYAGFEPQVGEILALRTFRVGPHGVLYPLFGDVPWRDGDNTARCALADPADPHPPHAAPEPTCSCGFYAYGSAEAAAEYPQARYVLGVVACWGRVIAGTRGLRAEHCRIEALWLAPRAVPADLVADVTQRHPSVRIFDERSAMVEAFAPTPLDCYEPQALRPPRPVGWHRLALTLLVALSALPTGWWRGLHLVDLVCSTVLGLVGLALLLGAGRSTEPDPGRRRLVAGGLIVWALAPLAGGAGLLLLRAPLALLVILLCLQWFEFQRAARQFPAAIG